MIKITVKGAPEESKLTFEEVPHNRLFLWRTDSPTPSNVWLKIRDTKDTPVGVLLSTGNAVSTGAFNGSLATLLNGEMSVKKA